MPGIVYSPTATAMLAILRRKFESSNRRNDLRSHFERQLKADGITDEERLLWQHSIAFLLWHDENHQAALAMLGDAIKQAPQRRDLRLGLVRQYELAKEPARALELLDTLTADNPAEQSAFEGTALRLATATKDSGRIKTALKRLSEGPVSNGELVSFAEKMIELELSHEAESILSKAFEAGPLPNVPLHMLMEVQLSHGKNDEATKTALRLLGQLETADAAAVVGQSSPASQQSPASQPRSPTEMRLSCYRVLLNAGKLQSVIESHEAQLKALPRSETLINRLISLHTAAGNHPRVVELGLELLKRNVDKPAGRYDLAMKYLELGKFDDALENLTILVDLDADYFASRCRASLHNLSGRKEVDDLALVLEKIDWGFSNKRLAVLPSMIDQIRRCPSIADKGPQLFVKTWKDHPERRIDLLQRFAEDQWWQHAEIRG